MTTIHPTALVDPKAELADDVSVGAYAVIGADVQIGAGCQIGSHVIIEGPTTLGERNTVAHHAVLGSDSQDMKFSGGDTYLKIGDDNIIREFATINRATEPGTTTVIGNNNRLLSYIHVAHNCTLGDNIIMSNVASLAGHVVIQNNAVLGGLVAVHQHCRLGELCFVGAGAKVVKDVPPFCIVDGVPAKLAGLNRIGLRRHEWSSERIDQIQRLLVMLFRRRRNIKLALEQTLSEVKADISANGDQNLLLEFIKSSKRGVAPWRRSG
jgi:UDP-N-acetylglucosamine acyltransferase